MIPADKNLSVMTVLQYHGSIMFGTNFIERTVKGTIIACPEKNIGREFPFTKEGLYEALKHLQKHNEV